MNSGSQQTDYSKPSRAAIFIILIAALFLFFKYLMNVSVSIMTPELMEVFKIHGTGLGIIGGAFLFAYLIVQLFSGILLDSFSIRLVCTLAILVSTLGLVFFGWATHFWEAIVGRSLQGIGAAFATVVYLKLAANWFHPRYFARLSGFVATAAMIGAVAGEAPLALLNQHFGWRAAIASCVVFGLVLTAIFVILVRNHPEKPPCPLQKGIEHYHIKWADITHILSKKENWLILFYTGLAFSPVAVFASLWGNPFLHSAYAISIANVPLYTTVMFIGLALGGPVLGGISDYLNNRGSVMFLSCACSLVLMILVIYVNGQPHWTLATELFLVGFMSGGFLLGFAIVKEMNPIMVAATVIAFANTGDPVVGAWTDPLIGIILDKHWDHTLINGAPIFSPHAYHIAMIILIVNLVAACVFVGLIFKRKKNQSTGQQPTAVS